ncbi:unnamed protein product [Hymenolepis diminuta]|uniref:Uncharacterized protein n=1 Tax=Hymenolepis diminuta TaxID=6216 RepID=A0A564XVY9_HYMDI|nr:unnamed protein product [Hymenolepis diminuta]
MDKFEKSHQIHKDVQSLESTLAQLSVQQKMLKEQLYELFLDFLPNETFEQNSVPI